MEIDAIDIDAQLEEEELRGNDMMGPLPSEDKQAEKTSDPYPQKLYHS